MLRKLLLGFGLVEIAIPRPIVDACERIGLENPEDVDRRSRALWGARLEGLVFVWLLARGRRDSGSRLVSALLGLAGAVLVLAPRPSIDLSQRLVYANTDDLELKPWVVPAARLLGGLYLLVVGLSVGAADDDSNATDDSAQSSTEDADAEAITLA